MRITGVHRRILLAAAILAFAGPARAAPTLGQPAPAFTARDAYGRERSLADFRGRIVVLEWHSPVCPYTAKHYRSGNMQRLQARATADGVAWLTIDSAAPQMLGFLGPAQARAWKATRKAHSTDLLIDADGKVGRLYGARATPQMFVIDKAGRLVYMGAIDDRPYADPASLKGATNYVARALGDLKAGRPIRHPVTEPYGCAVEYGSAE